MRFPEECHLHDGSLTILRQFCGAPTGKLSAEKKPAFNCYGQKGILATEGM